MSEDVKNVIVGKLERRVSKKTGSIYYCIDVYAKNKNGELKSISGGKPIYVDSEKLELLTEVYNLVPVDSK